MRTSRKIRKEKKSYIDIHKTSASLHDHDIKNSSEYTEGAHDVVGENARKSRDKAADFERKL